MAELFSVDQLIEILTAIDRLDKAYRRMTGELSKPEVRTAITVATYFISVATEWNSDEDTQELGDGPVDIRSFMVQRANDSGVIEIGNAFALPSTAAQLYALAFYGAMKLLALALAPSKKNADAKEVN